MTTLDTGPCQNWVPICDDFPEDPTEAQQLLIDQAVQAATEALWNRTKRRFGLCEVTVRPCRRECWPASSWIGWSGAWQNGSSWGWPFPSLVGGVWVNLGCSSCGSNCSCATVHEVRLPHPVAEIVEVKIDGQPLDPQAYRVDDHAWLVRTDGEAWPRCNDLGRSDNEEGTWSVTASYGEVVPTLGQFAVGQLASQIYKSCPGANATGCLLPAATVRQVTRQGVTKVFFDADTAFKHGRIGLYYPDLFIATYNPSGTGVASIMDIDGPRRRRVTDVSASS